MASVPEPRRARQIWVAIVLVLAALLLVSAFLPSDRVLRGICVVEPTKRWQLSELRPGTFESRAMDLAEDRLIHYRLFEFDRPSMMDLRLPALELGQSVPVEVGDVVVSFASTSLDLQIAERRSMLQSARARLSVLEAGSKASEIDRARVAVEQARADLDAYRKVFERGERLFADGIASEQDWQELQAEYRLKELNLELAGAELRILESGAKPEELEEVRVSIAGYEEELTALEQMQTAQDITSPISGRIMLGGAEGPLLSAGAVDSMIVKVLLPQRKARYPEPGQAFTARIPGAGIYRGEILRIDRRPLQTEAGTFLFAIGSVENADHSLEEGMQGRAEIRCGRTNFLDLLLGDLLWSLGLSNGDAGSALKPLQGWGLPRGY